MHSFHQRCVVDSDRECPKCAPEYRKVKEIKDSMRKSTAQHDKFFKQLQLSNDGFATVAEYFGRGIFDAGLGAASASASNNNNHNHSSSQYLKSPSSMSSHHGVVSHAPSPASPRHSEHKVSTLMDELP
jgi:hypothetical protein